MKPYLEDITTEPISPTPILNPKTPYYDWLFDMYGAEAILEILNKRKPPKPLKQILYVYVDSDGYCYQGIDGKIYTSGKGD